MGGKARRGDRAAGRDKGGLGRLVFIDIPRWCDVGIAKRVRGVGEVCSRGPRRRGVTEVSSRGVDGGSEGGWVSGWRTPGVSGKLLVGHDELLGYSERG